MTTELEPRADWYVSKDRSRAEWSHVWSTLWHMGPREEEIPAPGDWYVHTFGPESLLFVRGEDRVVRGFYNVCRHRANRLIVAEDGPGSGNAFQCAFHGWRYGLDGTLRDVPYRERFPCHALDDPGRTHLAQIRVDRFAGWIWFCLDSATPPLSDYLGPVAARLEPYGMSEATIVDYKTFRFRCNWKTVLDAFNESYHFQCLHSDILSWGSEDAPITLLGLHSMMVNRYGAPSPLYPDQVTVNPALAALLESTGIDPARFEGTAGDVRAAVQAAKRARQDDSVFPYRALTDGQLTDAYHFLVFPSVHFNLFPEFYVAMRYRPHPSLDPESMYFDFIMCAPLQPGESVPDYRHRIVEAGSEPVADVLEWGPRQHPIVNQVLEEDLGLLQSVQEGLRSQSFRGPLLSTDERRIGHFHASLDRLINGTSVTDLMRLWCIEPDAHSER